MILVPLPNTASRGEQTLNAKSFVKRGYAEIIKDEEIANSEILLKTIDSVYQNHDRYIQKMIENPVKITNADELSAHIAVF